MISYHPNLQTFQTGTPRTKGFNCYEGARLEDLGQVICRHAWSPCIWKLGHRSRNNFLYADWFALDFETHEFTLPQAVKTFQGQVHIIGTTRNHQKAKGDIPPLDRFRVLLKMNGKITDLKLYEFNVRSLAERYGADSACVDGARHFFPCTQIVSIESEGELEPILPLPADFEEAAAIRDRWLRKYASAGFVPSSIWRKLDVVIPPGKRNTTWYGFAKDLTVFGFTHEKIMKLILGSETYKGAVISPNLLREIEQCVRSGQKTRS